MRVRVNRKTGAVPASYVVWTDGARVYAENSLTGRVEFSSSDATEVLQSAIDALNGVGKVFLRRGEYLVDGIRIENPLTPDDSTLQHIILEGEGKFATILKLKDDANGAVSKDPSFTERAVILAEPKNGTSPAGIRVTIRCIGINGNREKQSRNICGIIVRGCRQAVVEDCWVYKASKFGILFDKPYLYREGVIRGNTVYLIDLCGPSPGEIPSPLEDNVCGIRSRQVDVEIVDNIVGQSGGRGVGIAAATSNTVERNWVWGAKAGIVLPRGTVDSSVQNNFIEQNHIEGVIVRGASRNIIAGNRIRMGSGTDSPHAGILIDGESSHNKVTDNMIWANEKYTLAYGVREVEPADYNYIMDNVILQHPGKVQVPIEKSGPNTRVENNIW